MIDRRTFLVRAGGLAAAAAAWQSAAACAAQQAVPDTDGSSAALAAAPLSLDRVGVQLYTVRDRLRQDADATLGEVAGVGYRLVETFGITGPGPATALRAQLDRHGLRSPSGHYAIEQLEGQFDDVIASARALGQEYVVVPWLAETRRRSLDDYRRFAEQLDRFGRRVKDAGLQLGYHNHDFEFNTFGGSTPAYDVLVSSTDPALVVLEADLYWMYKAGADPIRYFERFPGRFPLVHIKDGTAAPEKRMVDVGQGAIDWRRIFAAGARGGLRYGFVEHDQPDDSIRSIANSRRALESILRA